MPIEQVFVIVAAAGVAGCVIWWIRREQRLASSFISVTSAVLSRERLEELFVKFIANRGRDRWNVADDHIASQPNHCRHRSRRAGKAGCDRYAVLDQARERDRRTAMTEYLAIYERNDDGWWAYVPDLPGCTAVGDDRDEVERNAREAVAAHVELLRSTGRDVPTPTTYDVSRIAV